MTAISVEKITKRYEEHVAVDGISFQVPAGSVYGLLGPNGAGKTTTLRMIMNILRPDTGQVTILGRPSGGDTLDRVGYLPEERGMYLKMKVVDLLAFLAEIKGVSRRDAVPRIDRWLGRLELSDWKARKVQELSKGMQQKIQFIATILHEPEVIILDEPFSGLDPVNTNLLKDVVLEMNRAGTTVIFSTHIMEQVERMCEAICLIHHGRVVAEGALAAVKERYGTNSVVLGFHGDGEFLRALPNVEKIDLHGSYAEMRLVEGADPGAILAAAMPRVEVRRFEVVEPTLNSIFLDLVGEARADRRPPEDIPAPAGEPATGGAHV
ncbi:MAG: ABC transporter ATP-binding protein [Acidobacteriota bacterium]